MGGGGGGGGVAATPSRAGQRSAAAAGARTQGQRSNVPPSPPPYSLPTSDLYPPGQPPRFTCTRLRGDHPGAKRHGGGGSAGQGNGQGGGNPHSSREPGSCRCLPGCCGGKCSGSLRARTPPAPVIVAPPARRRPARTPPAPPPLIDFTPWLLTWAHGCRTAVWWKLPLAPTPRSPCCPTPATSCGPRRTRRCRCGPLGLAPVGQVNDALVVLAAAYGPSLTRHRHVCLPSVTMQCVSEQQRAIHCWACCVCACRNRQPSHRKNLPDTRREGLAAVHKPSCTNPPPCRFWLLSTTHPSV